MMYRSRCILLQISNILLTCSLVAIFTACSQDHTSHVLLADVNQGQVPDASQGPEPAQMRGVPSHSRQSDAAVSPLRVEGSRLHLQRSALGQPFLLSPSLVLATNTPILDHGQPMVVTFECADERLALFATNTAAVYTGLPTRRLLQTFSIVAHDADTVTFRWDFGLQAIGQRMPTVDSDAPFSLAAYVDAEESVLPVDDSYLADAYVRGDALILHQVARVRRTIIPVDVWQIFQGSFDHLPLETTVNAYFTLEPLKVSQTYVPKLSTRQKDVGFFEVATMRPGDGALDVYATRWDLRPAAGPITFRITNDVPSWLTDAVSEGVTYWNRVAGRTIVSVQTGADPSALPWEREVVIHWIPWRRAGFSRASVQPHPLTGEILRADIYVTSTFADAGADDVADAMWPEMPGSLDSQAQPSVSTRWLPKGFTGSPQCAYPAAGSAMARHALLAPHADILRVQQAVADNIRLVVAHEVGHTLGLRHNFAASSQSDVPDSAALTQLWRSYLADGSHTGAATATSVMDYLAGPDAFLLGAYIRDHALPYDVRAMHWGYAWRDDAGLHNDAGTEQMADAPLFCTDMEQFTGLVGCAAHDSGRNPLAGYMAAAVAAREAMPGWILSHFVDRLQPEYPGDRQTAKQIVEHFNFDNYALAVAIFGQATFNSLEESRRVLQVERAMGYRRVLDPEAYQDATRQQLDTWFSEIGGLPGFLLTVGDMQVDPSKPGISLPGGWLQRAVLTRIKDPAFASGTTARGRSYTLSPDNLAAMQKLVPQVASYLEESILRDLLLTLTGDVPGTKPEFNTGIGIGGFIQDLLHVSAHLQPKLVHPQWQRPLSMLAVSLVAGESDEQVHGMCKGESVVVNAPRFREDLRLAALRLLSPTVFGTPSWLESIREQLATHLRERLLSVAKDEAGLLNGLGLAGLVSGPTFSIPVDVSPELRRWAETEIRILEALTGLQDTNPLKAMTKGL